MARVSGRARAVGLAVDGVWWLSLAAVAVGAVLLVLVGGHLVGGGALGVDVYFRLAPGAYHIASHQLGGSAAMGLSSSQLKVARPTAGFVLVGAAVLAVGAGAWLFILGQLRRLLAALAAGEPFARENERRLRRIGLAVVAFAIGRGLVSWGAGLYLERSVAARGVSLGSHFGFDVPVIVLGILLLALAAAFRVGSALAEEQAMTV